MGEYWNSFPSYIPPGPSRVRTAVLTQSDAQQTAAEASKRRLRRRSGETVYTDIVPGSTFWPAERLHQKFNLQRVYPDLVQELAVGRPDVDAFLASPQATRLNAYVSGFLGEDTLAGVAREVGWEVGDLRQRLQKPENETELDEPDTASGP